MIQFDLPKEQSSILKVIGVGGGGNNAVNHMFSQDIEGVNFIVCNTDAQAIANSNVPNKVQLGPNLTQGLGAGANPEIGKEATEESLEEIKKILEVNTKMAFITAGMGGGTGTGGAPIIAKVCKELGILTVGIVTTPFAYEGKKRIAQAAEGIQNLKENVDTLLVISNDKLRHQFGNLTMKAAFAKADNVLATAAKCITDVINGTGQINVDFADVCTVMKNGGVAILGNAECSGENRAQKAIEQALNSPLLNDNDIRGAKWILININSAEGEFEFTMDEVETIQNYLLSHAGDDSDVILGLGYDNSLEDKVSITLIATGFDHKEIIPVRVEEEPVEKKAEKVVMELKPEKKPTSQPLFLFDSADDEKAVIEPAEGIAEDKNLKEEENSPLNKEKINEALGKETDAMPVELRPTISGNAYEGTDGKDLDIRNENNGEKVDKSERPVVHFELPSDNLTVSDKKLSLSEDSSQKENREAGNPSSSEGYLVKPKQIYAEDIPELESEADENHSSLHEPVKEDEPEQEMQLVEKNSKDAAERKEENVHQTKPIMISDAEEPPTVDKAEEQKRKAMDRIAKLRNLSFNGNTADPNNEFDSVPAYLRRNMELHNSIAQVESFYSNYQVKSDDQNQAEISTINTFLEGKKPD